MTHRDVTGMTKRSFSVTQMVFQSRLFRVSSAHLQDVHQFVGSSSSFLLHDSSLTKILREIIQLVFKKKNFLLVITLIIESSIKYVFFKSLLPHPDGLILLNTSATKNRNPV